MLSRHSVATATRVAVGIKWSNRHTSHEAMGLVTAATGATATVASASRRLFGRLPLLEATTTRRARTLEVGRASRTPTPKLPIVPTRCYSSEAGVTNKVSHDKRRNSSFLCVLIVKSRTSLCRFQETTSASETEHSSKSK